MRLRELDVADIALHTAASAAMSALSAFLLYCAVQTEGWLAIALLIASVGLLGANLVFWPLRELDQHGGRWGGLQSQLEWIVPDVVGIAVFVGVLLW